MGKALCYLALFVCFVLLPGLAFGQNKTTLSKQLNYLIAQTYNLMQTERFRIRPNIAKDSPHLAYNVIDTMTTLEAFLGGYASDTTVFRYYRFPTINVAKHIDSILRFAIDTNSLEFTYAQSAIIHEITHYLATIYPTTNYIENSRFNYKDYLKSPSELVAFISAAIFFTKKYNSAKYDEIINNSKTRVQKYTALSNCYFPTTGLDSHTYWEQK